MDGKEDVAVLLWSRGVRLKEYRGECEVGTKTPVCTGGEDFHHHSQTKRRRREWMTFINNDRSGSESFSCIILNRAKPTDHSRAICRADQESTVPCCRVKTMYFGEAAIIYLSP
jgi:hypothetical protein